MGSLQDHSRTITISDDVETVLGRLRMAAARSEHFRILEILIDRAIAVFSQRVSSSSFVWNRNLQSPYERIVVWKLAVYVFFSLSEEAIIIDRLWLTPWEDGAPPQGPRPAKSDLFDPIKRCGTVCEPDLLLELLSNQPQQLAEILTELSKTRRIQVDGIVRWNSAIREFERNIAGVLARLSDAEQAIWASGAGDDVNPRNRMVPSKTFAGTISATATGQIDCLDPGGFGCVTITKSMTFAIEGVTVGVLAFCIHGGDVVTGTHRLLFLKYLDMEFKGNNGTGGAIRIAPTARTIDHVLANGNICGIAASGAAGTSGVNVPIDDGYINGHFLAGVASTTATGIERGAVCSNGTGFRTPGIGADIRAGHSRISGTTDNTTVGGMLLSYAANQVNGNTFAPIPPRPLLPDYRTH
jgi:hypothetical protein